MNEIITHFENHFRRIENKLDLLIQQINSILRKEFQIMAIGQEIIDAVAEESTVIDSVLALLQGLIDNGTISAADGAKILSAISVDKAKMNAALVKNTL